MTSAEPTTPAGASQERGGGLRFRGNLIDRRALLVFVGVETVMLVTFPPHFGHGSTLQVLLDRGLFHLVGLHTHLPYQLVILVLHLTAAALLRIVMI